MTTQRKTRRRAIAAKTAAKPLAQTAPKVVERRKASKLPVAEPSELLRCAYLERASAHVALGLLPAIADLEVKLALGAHQHKAILRSLRLERVLGCVGVRGRVELAVPAAWRRRMQQLDASGDVAHVVRELCVVIKRELAVAYRSARARLDAMLDAPLVQILDAATSETATELAWADRVLYVASPDLAASQRGAAPIEEVVAGDRALRGELVPRARWLWKPLRRERIATRPASLATHDVAGAVVVPAIKPGKRSAALMLHQNIDAEVSTMELYGRCSYEHAELPEEFHRDVSRQTYDESRHARACMDEAAAHGAPLGTWPVSTDMYDFHYQFGPCKPGSKRELLWRLLLRSTFQEALSLDAFVPLSARLGHDRAVRAARVLESITADEVFHVEAGVKWSRYLCGGDSAKVQAEREAAHRYYRACAVRARKQYVRDNPEQAVDETVKSQRVAKQARSRYPFDLGIYMAEATRRAIGFTDGDLEQVERWGYARRER